MQIPSRGPRWFRDGLTSTLLTGVCMVRGLTLLLYGRPRTPLRILCIVAFDTLHALRLGSLLSTPRRHTLAALLDYCAYSNTVFDRKSCHRPERKATLRLLEQAGLGSLLEDHLRRLGEREGTRPMPGGEARQFEDVRKYREDVVRLSLQMAATVSCGNPSLDSAATATYPECDLELLFRLAMQCQIIDDVLDYRGDRATGLPSFLTACESLPTSLKLTLKASRRYADVGPLALPGDLLPLRTALAIISVCARLLVSTSIRSAHPIPKAAHDRD